MFAFIIITHYHCRRRRLRWRWLRRILRTFLGTLGEIASDLFERAPWLLYVLLTPSWSSSRSQRWHWYNHWARAESETERQTERSRRDMARNAAVTLLTFAFNLFISNLLRLFPLYFFFFYMLLSLIFVEEGFLFVFLSVCLGCACICLA